MFKAQVNINHKAILGIDLWYCMYLLLLLGGAGPPPNAQYWGDQGPLAPPPPVPTPLHFKGTAIALAYYIISCDRILLLGDLSVHIIPFPKTTQLQLMAEYRAISWILKKSR